jgi:hypothetical protein
MPNELRDPLYRFGHFSLEVARVYEIYLLLSSAAVQERGLQQFTVDAFWPDMEQHEKRMLVIGTIELDNFHREKRELSENGASS